MVAPLNKRLFEEAKRFIAGGVNSPVRSFKSVGGKPIFIKKAKGSKIYSEEGKVFIDYCQSFGALILGHAHQRVVAELKNSVEEGFTFGAPTKKETELAKLICKAVPSIEKIRFTNSGTEAVMGAVRLARAFTQKERIIKFEGAYHGHADYLLDYKGVPIDFKRQTIILPYNDIEKVEEVVKRSRKDVAAIIVEPICGNMGVVLPKNDFLISLREIASKYKVILIFDEVITGFRLKFGGAQGLFKIKPDLTCLGKIIGGGLPVGAFGGRKEIMRLLSPEGEVYQAGTFSGNNLTVSAGLATLKILSRDNPYARLEQLCRRLSEKIRALAIECNIKLKINFIGSMFSIFFTEEDVIDYRSAARQNMHLFRKFFKAILREGIYFSPSGLEANFLSGSHSLSDIEITLQAIEKTFKSLKGEDR